MQTQSLFRRVVFPIGLVLGVMIVSINAYNLSIHIENRTIYKVVVHGSAALMFLSIWLGPLFGNTIAFFQGASFGERLLVSLFTPVIWGLKVWLDFRGIYSTGESLFLLLHHLILGCPVVALLTMGISEIWCRAIYRLRSKDKAIRVLGFGNLSIFFIGAGLSVLMLWNGGHFYYYKYMDVYSWLFL